MAGLIQELKRRNVFKVGTAYVVMTWLAAQVADIFLEPLGVPEWFIQSLLILLLIGFPVTIVLAWVYELTPDGIRKEKDVDRSQSVTRQTGQKLNHAIIAVLVLAVGLLLFDRFRPKEEAPSVAAEPDVVVTETSAEPSIAVLPFVDMSPNRDQDYFSDGISEEILNALAKVKELKVAGRTSSFAFKGQSQDLRQIGETLNVDHILEGSVRTSGDKVRITAQLIQVDDGFHLWSETYDRVLDDVFAIQDEIANAILEQMKSNLLEDVQQVATTSVTDPEVYNLYLMARQRMYLRTQAGLESAHELLDQAIAKDPEYAPVYALRGITTLLLADDSYGTIPREQAYSQAKIYLDRALQLDPNSAETLAGLGLHALNATEDYDESINYLQRALAINPNLIDASNWLQQVMVRQDRSREAMRILEGMFERDPFYRPGFSNLVARYLDFNRLEDVQRVMDRVRPTFQNDTFYLVKESDLLSRRGELAQALDRAELALELQSNSYSARANLGFRLMNTAQWERLHELGVPWQRVYALSKLGRREEAIIQGSEIAASGRNLGLTALWSTYLANDQPERLVRFYNERWQSLDGFVRDNPLTHFEAVINLLHLALAFRSTDDMKQFDQAMSLAQTIVQRDIEQGYLNRFNSLTHALYYTMAGDYETAVEQVEQAFELGLFFSGDFTDWPILKVHRGDPRFEAVQARMREHVNREREKLGLEPIET
jgi:TolB-like protein/Tfp pilus assembly protein PilF